MARIENATDFLPPDSCCQLGLTNAGRFERLEHHEPDRYLWIDRDGMLSRTGPSAGVSKALIPMALGLPHRVCIVVALSGPSPEPLGRSRDASSSFPGVLRQTNVRWRPGEHH